MNLTPESIAWLITIGSAVGSTLFWGVFHLGQFRSEIVRAHKRLDEHDDQIGELHSRRRDDPHPWEPRR